MNASPLLHIRTIAVRRGPFHLSIEEFSVYPSENIAIIGHNGAGKTTLLFAIAGLIKPERLDLVFKGNTITSARDFSLLRKSVTMVFQEPLLLHASVRDNIALGLKIRKIQSSVIKRKVDEYGEMLRIGHLLSRPTHTLSAGEARRVSLARAFVLQPNLLLMDEPFSSLDVHSREEMMDDFEKIARKSGSSVLFVSHDRFETLRLADRIIVLQNGRMLQHGNPNEIINKPADAFAASFMGVENLLIARVKEVFDTGFVAEIRGSTIEVAAHAAPNETVTLGIRPENVVISKTPSASSMRNTFPGKVTDISAAGIHARVTVDCGFRLIAYITPHSVNELALVRGSEISASFKATAIHVFRHSPLKTDITTS